jgi:hypothetical protein
VKNQLCYGLEELCEKLNGCLEVTEGALDFRNKEIRWGQPAISYLNRLCISIYSTVQLPSGPWAICSYGAAAHCTIVVSLETIIHYGIYGLKV